MFCEKCGHYVFLLIIIWINNTNSTFLRYKCFINISSCINVNTTTLIWREKNPNTCSSIFHICFVSLTVIGGIWNSHRGWPLVHRVTLYRTTLWIVAECLIRNIVVMGNCFHCFRPLHSMSITQLAQIKKCTNVYQLFGKTSVINMWHCVYILVVL